MDLSALIRFAQGAAVLPVLSRVWEMTDQDLARAAGYLRGLFRHAVRPADKTYAGAQTFQVLAAWGRYRQAQETALELLSWLEACPRWDEHPICMRTALSLCREGAEWLEDFDRAEEYGFRAEQLEVPDGRLTEEDESYAPPSPPPLLAQQIERTAALEQAIAQGQTERAASWYEDSRRWFCQNGQNPARLDLMMGRLYEALGERRITLCRELTKKFETVFPTTLRDALHYYETNQPRGEYVLVLEGKSRREKEKERQDACAQMSLEEHMSLYEEQGIDRKEAMKRVAKDRGISRREVYQYFLERRG